MRERLPVPNPIPNLQKRPLDQFVLLLAEAHEVALLRWFTGRSATARAPIPPRHCRHVAALPAHLVIPLVKHRTLDRLQVVSLNMSLLIDDHAMLYHCVLPGDSVRVLLDHARRLFIELRQVGLGGHIPKLHPLLRLLSIVIVVFLNLFLRCVLCFRVAAKLLGGWLGVGVGVAGRARLTALMVVLYLVVWLLMLFSFGLDIYGCC